MNLSTRRGVFFLLTSQWSQVLIQVCSVVVLSHVLAPRSFGLVAMVSAITGLAALVSEFGMSLSALVGATPTPQERSNLFWVNAATGLIVMAVLIGLSPLLASFYHRPELIAVTIVLSVPYLLGALSVQFRVELTLMEAWARLAIVEALPSLLTLGLSIVLALATHSYWSLVIPTVVAAILQLGLAVGISGWRPTRPRNIRGIGHHLRFGRDTLGLQALNYMASNGDSVLIGRSLGASVLGQYNRAYTLGVMPVGQIAAPLTRLVLPRLSTVPADEFDHHLSRYQVVLIYAQIGPISLLVATARPLVRLLLGPGWPDVPILTQIQALGAAFSAVGYIFYWAYLVRRKTGVLAVSEGVCEVLLLAAMVFAVTHGATWVAWCVAGGQLLIMLSSAVISRRVLGIDVLRLARVSAPPVFAFALATGAGLLTVRALHGEAPLIELLASGTAWAASLLVVHAGSSHLRSDAHGLMALLRRREQAAEVPVS